MLQTTHAFLRENNMKSFHIKKQEKHICYEQHKPGRSLQSMSVSVFPFLGAILKEISKLKWIFIMLIELLSTI